MDFYRPVWAEVNLNNIKDNLRFIRTLIPKSTKIMAIVKANGYGHGKIRVAQASIKAGIERLGVASVEEALELINNNIKVPIHLLSEPPISSVKVLVKNSTSNNLIISVAYTKDFVRALSKEASKKNRRCLVHVKVDTGMHRVGISIEKAVDLVKYISSLQNIEIEGLFTHFACADDPENPYTLLQFERFLKLREILEKNNFKFKNYHCANSAAMLNFPETHLDMVRIGIAMYGLRPSEKTFSPKLKPALSLKAKISYLKEVEKGEGISYGLTFKANKKSLIATIPIGYGDGYPRQLLNSGVVLVRGKRVPVVGNVTMDQIMIDVTDLNEIEIGDEVVIIGNQGKVKIEVNELSRALDTIDYEIVCGITNRVPRIYVD